jgi:hypothetical protein
MKINGPEKIGYRPYPQLIIQECSFGAQKGDEWSA